MPRPGYQPPQRKYCNARKQNGERCKNAPGAETDHPGFGLCKYHGGTSPPGRINAARAEALARLPVLGRPVDIEPTEALLQQVRISAGHVAWYLETIRKLDAVGETDREVLLKLAEKGWERQAYMQLYNEERDRLVRFAKTALDAGVAERQVQLAERQGELIAIAIRGMLKDLGLSEEQEKAAPAIVARHLRAVAS